MIKTIKPYKMKIFLIISIIILPIFFIGNKIYSSAKRNLLKNQAAWSGKDIKIKYIKSKNNSQLKKNDNYLEIIAAESKIYLEDQPYTEGE